MAEPLTDQEKEELRAILRHFYGDVVDRWRITLRTFEVFGELIKNTKACDDAVDFVPRPYGGGNAVKWTIKQVRKAVLRHFRRPDAKHYIICMKTAALSRRSQFEMAQYGM